MYICMYVCVGPGGEVVCALIHGSRVRVPPSGGSRGFLS